MPKKKVSGVVQVTDFNAWYKLTSGWPKTASAKMKVSHAHVAQFSEDNHQFFCAWHRPLDHEEMIVVAIYGGVLYWAEVDPTQAGVIWQGLPEVVKLEVTY